MGHVISRYTVTVGDGNINSGNIDNSVITIYNTHEDAKIMHWLSPLEPENRHHTLRAGRFEGVGNWLLETSEFREWRGGEGGADKAVVFCSGDPGVGKTHLSSLVIDSLCDQAREGDLAVAWLYCDYNAQQEQTVIDMMGAILMRLVGQEIPQDIREAFQERRRPLLADLIQMLKIAISSKPQVFICIDALDECVPEDLSELLGSLSDIARESPRMRIFFTGRPHVKEAVQTCFSKAVEIPISPKKDDIKNYLDMRLDKDNEPKAMDNDLRAEIVTTILEKMPDTFLLVSLNIKAILGEVTISDRREKLREMARGSGLSDAYTATLTRLKTQKGGKSVLGMKVLMWVLYSERPLQANELCHALGVRMGSTDLDPKNIPNLQTLVSSCVGLVTVEASSSIVRLVHFTLQEHLLRDPTLFQSPHSTIAEVCLTYLNFKSVRVLPPTRRSVSSHSSTMQLLRYASVYWGEHTRRGMTENVKILALRLLDRFDEHISAVLLPDHLRNIYRRNPNTRPEIDRRVDNSGSRGLTGLHAVAVLGIAELLTPLLDMKKWDVNAVDFRGNTPLTWAIERRQEEVIKVLLGREDVNPNQVDTRYGGTLFMFAIESGHEGVVKIFLERNDINHNKAHTKDGRTPLSLAVEIGHKRVVKMLLEREDVNPDYADEYCHTPLDCAAWMGHEEIVKMLLEREVNPDRADMFGRTPLSRAAERGYEGIVKMLLEREEVTPDHADNQYGQTPLDRAAWMGHVGIVKVLLERKDVNPHHIDTQGGQTPLERAAWKGHEEIVKMLLEREEVNPDWADMFGQTPLSRAAEGGHEGVVKMLLEREGVNPDHADNVYGQTPLQRAAWMGHEAIVKMLLEREEVNPDRADMFGRAPLLRAAEGGHEGVVKMLLERGEVNPDRADMSGQKPLTWAAWTGHEEIVKMLLEREEVNPGHIDTQSGQTPLNVAAWMGHDEIVRMLLEREEVNPCWADRLGRTPLLRAAFEGHEGIVEMLLEKEGVNPDHADNEYGQTPLLHAASKGHVEVVKVLLERMDVDPDHVDIQAGQTPLHVAAYRGHEAIVKMLLEREEVNPDRADMFGRTPLSWAAEGGREGVVKMLLERDRVNPDQADIKFRRTPLVWATVSGHLGVVKMLLERARSGRPRIRKNTSLVVGRREVRRGRKAAFRQGGR